MRMTPIRIMLLFIITVAVSSLGIVLMAVAAHGSQLHLYLGAFLLLPSIILLRLGVPIRIPFLETIGILSVVLFVLLQALYYFGLLQIARYLARLRRKTSR